MIAMLAFVACVEDVSKDKVELQVEEAPKTEEAARTAPPEAPKGEAWAVDLSKSKLEALGAKITAKHPIVFHDYEGTVTVDGDKVSGVSFTVQMASLEADVAKLTSHLKTEDFFHVEKFPTATFTSSEVREGSTVPEMTHTVKGTFTIRGETKLVTFPARITLEGREVHASTEFALDRQDFAITYPGRPDDLVQDKVVLTVDFHAAKPQS